MNQPSAGIILVRCWTCLASLGCSRFNSADIWSELASIPLQLIIWPRNLLELTPNIHFEALRRSLSLRRIPRTSFKSFRWSSFSNTLYQHVINVHLHRLPDQVSEHSGYHLLVRGPYILQPEGYHFVIIDPLGSDKCCFLLVGQGHRDLVVALKCIQKAHLLMARSWIHQLVYSWKRKGILQTSFVQVGKIYTYPLFSILLLYHHSVRKPGLVSNWPNSISIQQSPDFFHYYFGSFGGQLSMLLSDRLDFGKYV